MDKNLNINALKGFVYSKRIDLFDLSIESSCTPDYFFGIN